jgi:hypothetical protein
MLDLVREHSKAKGWYLDVTHEVDRLEADLAAIQATLRTLEEKTALARAETTGVHDQVAGASLTPSAFVCFPSVSVSEVVQGAKPPMSQVERGRRPPPGLRRMNCAAA